MGGTVEIRCPQTGYHATIEFLTKPFYGGKRNKVTAEVCTYLKKIYIYNSYANCFIYFHSMQIYAPNEKKPFVSIAGEWSGLMEAKWHDKNVIFTLLRLCNNSLFKFFVPFSMLV